MQRPNFGSEQPNSLPKFKMKFYKRQIYSFAYLGSEFFCPQPKCKCGGGMGAGKRRGGEAAEDCGGEGRRRTAVDGLKK